MQEALEKHDKQIWYMLIKLKSNNEKLYSSQIYSFITIRKKRMNMKLYTMFVD